MAFSITRLRKGLGKARRGFWGRIRRAALASGLDAESREALEEILIEADVGVAATQRILDRLEKADAVGEDAIHNALRDSLLEVLGRAREEPEIPGGRPRVILLVGVNGVGKTTTLAKLAARYKAEGMRVMMAAADTFRAAAAEQLEVWAERVGVDLVRQRSGADPAAVAYDALESARARGVDVLLVDTAGRLHTKHNLMEELKKIRRVLDKCEPGTPDEVLLILDATTGQNALSQARLFKEAVEPTGLVIAKLDGTAKAGIVLAIREELGLDVRFVGLGEGVGDLERFAPEAFVDALLS
ncbi:MAG: signal recognition particle-docking protein FtsY [Candidatus Eisenbacteria sp.]|nr:signal recognition particle-docking protein FtsY [Candidatus Eisenbacteria bacterium]